MAVIPVREGVKALSEGLPAPTLTRHSWRGKGRAWVEVRGLDGPDGAELGRLVVDAVRARSGVKSVSVNRPLSRIVVTLNNDQISLRDLCRDVDEAEKRWRASGSVEQRRSDTRPKPLPGDGLLLATNALGVGATAVGVSAAVAGPGAALAAPVQPVSRRWWWPSTTSHGCAACSRIASGTRRRTRCCRSRWSPRTSSSCRRRRWPSTSRWRR